jgi:type I restriction enzyme S subunit
MTDIGIDALPKGWNLKQIGEVVAEAQSGFACGERDEKGVVQLRMNNVATTGQFDWKAFVRVPVDNEQLSRYRLGSGDVLFNNTNSMELVGKCALFSGYQEPVVYSNHFTRMRTRPTVCDPAFFSFWLNHLWHTGLFLRICDRWVGQSAVKFDKLGKLEIPLPPLAEQERIAAILKTKLASVERARKASLACLEASRKLLEAYLNNVFDKESSNNWPLQPLGELISSPIRTGISRPEDQTSGFQCLTLAAVRNGTLLLNKSKPIALTQGQFLENRLRPNAFYVVRGNGNRSLVGRGGLAPSNAENVVFPDLLFQIIPNREKILPTFLRWAWDSRRVREQIEEKSMTAAGIFKINQRNLAAICIPTPPLETQRHVSLALSVRAAQVARLTKLIEVERDEISILPASLLRQAFSGAL